MGPRRHATTGFVLITKNTSTKYIQIWGPTDLGALYSRTRCTCPRYGPGWQPLLRCILAGNQGVAGLRPVRARRRRLLQGRRRQRRGPLGPPRRVGARGRAPTPLGRPPHRRRALRRRVPPHVARRRRGRPRPAPARLPLHAARRAGADLPIVRPVSSPPSRTSRPPRHREGTAVLIPLACLAFFLTLLSSIQSLLCINQYLNDVIN